MFARSIAAFVFILPVFTSATYLPHKGFGPSTGGNGSGLNRGPTARPTNGINQCNTGPVQCCNSLQTASSSSLAGLLGVFGGVVGAPESLIGANCSPITALGVGSNSCTTQPVCCTGNHFRGLIVLGCSPINL